MIAQWFSAAVLVVAGLGLLAAAGRTQRRSIVDELRVIDGGSSQAGRRWRSTAWGVLGSAGLLLAPLWLLLAGAPWQVAAACALALVGVVVAMVQELRLMLRGRGTAVVPFTLGWQRRLGVRLVRALMATRPVPPLRPVMHARGGRPTVAASSRGDVRLLVVAVPGESDGIRMWTIAEDYLGSRLRYRDLVALNRNRRDPTGRPITEDTVLHDGWALLVPGDARGPGLVPLPAGAVTAHNADAAAAERRVPADGDGAEMGPGAVAGSAADPVPADTAAAAGVVAPADAGTGPPGLVSELVSLAEPPAPPPVPPPAPEPVTPVPAATGSATPGPVPLPRPPVPATGARNGVTGPGADREPPPGFPRAPLAWDVVHGRLLADGILDTLDGLRERRAQSRRTGLGVPLPDPAAAAIEEAAHVGADRAGGEFLDLALRLLAAGLAERGTPHPDVVTVHLGPDLIELRLASADLDPPPPFETSASGLRWFLGRDAAGTDGPDVAPRMPLLVSVGPDQFGRLLLNLPAGELVSLAGPPMGCVRVALALAVELVVKRWAEAPLVHLVGFGSELAGFSPRLRCSDRAPEGRVEGDVVILAGPPAPDLLARLRTGGGGGWFPVPTIITVGACEGARWQLTLGREGTLTCPDPDFRVGAQALRPDTAAALTGLAKVERRTELPGVRSSTILLPRPVRETGAEVVARLFGRPRLTRGDALLPAGPRTVELVSFLALSGASTRSDVAGALWPRGVGGAEFAAVLAEAAAALGEDSTGVPLLHTGEVLDLAPAVQLDWHLFVAAAARGADDEALSLLPEGRFAAPVVRWFAWMARTPLLRQLPAHVADVAARRAATSRDRAPAQRPGRHRRSGDDAVDPDRAHRPADRPAMPAPA
jgi:hypothetical protein